MTSRKTPQDDPQPDADVIEGVAVEKPAAAKKARKNASKSAAGSSQMGASSQQDGKPRGDDISPKSESPKSESAEKPAPSRSRSGGVIATGLASMALVIAIGHAAFQYQTDADDQSELQTRIADLEAALASSSARAAASQAQMAETTARLEAEKSELSSRLDAFAASIPADQSVELSRLKAEFQTRLASLEPAVEALTRQMDGGAGMSAAADASHMKLVLTRTALSAVAAMTAEMASGGRPERWLEPLQSLSKAGLDLGDLDELTKVMTPPPPDISDLVTQGEGLAKQLRDGAGVNDSDGWWQAATGQLSNFITLRAASGEPAAGTTTLSEFEAALSARDLRSAVMAAKMIEAADEDMMSAWDQWMRDAQRRLVLDDRLVGLTASLLADLTALLQSNMSPSGDTSIGRGDS